MGKSGCTLKRLFNTHHLVVGGFRFRCNRKANPSGLGNKTVTSEQFPSQQGDQANEQCFDRHLQAELWQGCKREPGPCGFPRSDKGPLGKNP